MGGDATTVGSGECGDQPHAIPSRRVRCIRAPSSRLPVTTSQGPPSWRPREEATSMRAHCLQGRALFEVLARTLPF